MATKMSAVERFRSERQAQGAWTVDGKQTPLYTEALLAQTRLWMKGISTHNRLTGECCPDFSCCHADMLTEQPKRDEWGQRKLMEFGGE